MAQNKQTSADDSSDKIQAFGSEMEELGASLRSASAIWTVPIAEPDLLQSADVWASANENASRGLLLASMGRAKAVMDLFDSGRGLRGLAKKLQGISSRATEHYVQRLEALVPEEERINDGITAALGRLEELHAQAKSSGEIATSVALEWEAVEAQLESLQAQHAVLQAGANLHLGKAPLLMMLPTFTAAVDELDRTAAARRRQRRTARVSHPAFQFIVLLLLGVVAVNVVSDRLSGIGSLWVWAFAIASFVALDYFLEPWIEKQRDRQANILLQRELDATRQVVEGIPLILATLLMMSAVVEGLDDLGDTVVSVGQDFLPRAQEIVRMARSELVPQVPDLENSAPNAEPGTSAS